jgi:hypothetical protein
VRPIVIRGAAVQSLSKVARACRAISAIEPSSEAEMLARDGLLAIIKATRSDLRREAIKQLIIRRRTV